MAISGSKLATLFGASAIGLMASGCAGVAPSSSYGEGPDYTGQRSRISNMPTNCTITTEEKKGTVIGGTIIFDPRNSDARRKCVASDFEKQRNAGTDPLRETSRTLGDANRIISQGNRILKNLGNFGF